jgi:tetratricopeptide (TPR) repeat protein
MSDFNGSSPLWDRLRRHPAVQAGLVYLGAGWALIQAADVFLPGSGVVRWLGLVLAAGFVAVVGVTWWLAIVRSRPAAERRRVAPAEPGAHRRRRRLTYGSAVALLALGGVLWWIRPAIVGAVTPDAQVIAVLPFHTSGPAVELLGEGMVDLLSTNLDGVGGIRAVDPRTVLYRWRQRAAGGSLDMAGSLGVGRDVEAGAVLLGSVVSAGSSVRLAAEVHSVRGVELARAQAEGAADSLLSLVDSLSIRLLRTVWLARSPIPSLDVRGITTGSLPAIRAYLEGLQHYRRSAWDSAIVALERAVAEDSSFALAHYRLAMTYGWKEHLGGAGSVRPGEAALRFADRLRPEERTLVLGHALYQKGDLAAYDTMQAFVRRYPDSAEGWYMLGEVYMHAQPLLGPDIEDIIEPFDRALELDPSFSPAIIHPLDLSLLTADTARYGRYLGKLEAVADSAFFEPYHLAARLWESPDSFSARLCSLLRGRTFPGLFALLLGSYDAGSVTPEMLIEGAAACEDSGPAVGYRLTPIWFRAMALSALGRIAEARVLCDSMWTIAPGASQAFWCIEPVLAGLADSAFAARQLAAIAEGSEAGSLFLRSLIALGQGRADDARLLLRRSREQLRAEPAAVSLFLQPVIEAAGTWADILDGDTRAELEELKAGIEKSGFSQRLALTAPLRFAYAQALATRPESRAEGLRRLRYAQPIEYAATRHLAIALALEQAGDTVGAAREYSQFIRLWEGADPELQPRVEAARRALERLAAEGN